MQRGQDNKAKKGTWSGRGGRVSRKIEIWIIISCDWHRSRKLTGRVHGCVSVCQIRLAVNPIKHCCYWMPLSPLQSPIHFTPGCHCWKLSFDTHTHTNRLKKSVGVVSSREVTVCVCRRWLTALSNSTSTAAWRGRSYFRRKKAGQVWCHMQNASVRLQFECVNSPTARQETQLAWVHLKFI